MSTPMAATDRRWESAAERQAAARDAYRASVEAGTPLSGAELGRRFDRSPQWGRAIVAKARHQATSVRHVDANPPHATGSTDMSSGAATAPTGGPDSPAALGDHGHRATVRAQRIDSVIVAVVALVAAVASYEHQRTLAVLAGEGDLAYVLPISVDGMMLATSRSILRRRRAGLRVPGLSWFGFLLGFVGSVAANVAAAEPTLVGRLVAAWPPVALFIAYETLAADHGDGRSGR